MGGCGSGGCPFYACQVRGPEWAPKPLKEAVCVRTPPPQSFGASLPLQLQRPDSFLWRHEGNPAILCHLVWRAVWCHSWTEQTEVLSRNNERAFCKEKVGSRKQVSAGVLVSIFRVAYTLQTHYLFRVWVGRAVFLFRLLTLLMYYLKSPNRCDGVLNSLQCFLSVYQFYQSLAFWHNRYWRMPPLTYSSNYWKCWQISVCSRRC